MKRLNRVEAQSSIRFDYDNSKFELIWGAFLRVSGERYTGSVAVSGSIPTVSTQKNEVLWPRFFYINISNTCRWCRLSVHSGTAAIVYSYRIIIQTTTERTWFVIYVACDNDIPLFCRGHKIAFREEWSNKKESFNRAEMVCRPHIYSNEGL